MKRLIGILALSLSLSACATAKQRHNTAMTFEMIGAATMSAGAGMLAKGMICYNINEWGGQGQNLDECHESMLTAIPFAVAGNIIFWAAEPARKRAKEEMKAEKDYVEISQQEVEDIMEDFCVHNPKNIACLMEKGKKK